MEEPKPRHLVLEAHIVAYLGDYLTLFEESLKRLAQQAVQQLPPKKAECSPDDPKYTASARNHS